MAIEIIPKKAKEIPSWQNILMYILVILLIFLISIYFILHYFVQKKESSLNDLENQLVAAKTPQEELKNEMKAYQRKINDFVVLISKHKRSSQLFTLLEELCHPKVFFSKLDLNVKSNQATLTGSTESLETLEQQILIFKEERNFQDIKLTSVGKGEDEAIEFQLVISANPTIFK